MQAEGAPRAHVLVDVGATHATVVCARFSAASSGAPDDKAFQVASPFKPRVACEPFATASYRLLPGPLHLN